jgi:hypothetical protein
MTSKQCSKCGKDKPLSEFAPNRIGKGGRVSWCKVCMAEHNSTARRNKAKAAGYPPDNTCQICFQVSTKTLSLDHNHKTGKFRGWLCNNCNTGLGMFKDSPEILQRALLYLRQ